MKFILVLICIVGSAWSAPEFYATEALQAKYPAAFATQPVARSFHQELTATAKRERDVLVKAIKNHSRLLNEILNFENLLLEDQVRVLRELFVLECAVMKITPPELIIDETSISGYAFFEFNHQQGGPGKVYLNKKKLKEMNNKSEFVLLLLHETRHSAQFQLSQHSHSSLAQGFEASFKAQSTLKIKTFCDFMLLLNEYEAFQFANYVYGSLTNWKTVINDMGTLAGQYDQRGQLRINIIDVISHPNPIEFFNALSQEQYEVMYE